MAHVSVEGIYKDGRVELAELPEGVEAPSRVIVTFLEPASRPDPARPPGVEPTHPAPTGPETPEKPDPPRGPRQGGFWRGRVWMADDFDTLPDDIAEAFGMGPG